MIIRTIYCVFMSRRQITVRAEDLILQPSTCNKHVPNASNAVPFSDNLVRQLTAVHIVVVVAVVSDSGSRGGLSLPTYVSGQLGGKTTSQNRGMVSAQSWNVRSKTHENDLLPWFTTA